MAVSLSRSSSPLPRTYLEVMRHIRRVGHIRPVEAGLILYADRDAHESRYRYASADGSELLRRMAKRGLVHWEARGRWVAGAPSEPVKLRASEGGTRTRTDVGY